MDTNSRILSNALNAADMKFTMVQFKSLNENLSLEIERFANSALNTLNKADENTTERSIYRFVNPNIAETLNSEIKCFTGSSMDCFNKINTTKANRKISGKSNTIVTTAQTHHMEMSSIRKGAGSLSELNLDDMYSKCSQSERPLEFERVECNPLQLVVTLRGEKETTESINETSESGKIKDNALLFEPNFPLELLSSEHVRFAENNGLLCRHFDLSQMNTRENSYLKSVIRNWKEFNLKKSQTESKVRDSSLRNGNSLSSEFEFLGFENEKYLKDYFELTTKKLDFVKKVGENVNGIIKSREKISVDNYKLLGRCRKRLGFEQNVNSRVEFRAEDNIVYTNGGNKLLGSVENIRDEERLDGITRIPSRVNGMRNLSRKSNDEAASKKKLDENTNDRINAESEKRLNENTNEQINAESEKKIDENTNENEQINAESAKKLHENTGKHDRKPYSRKGENENIDCKRNENNEHNKTEDNNTTESKKNSNKEMEEVARVEDNNVMKNKIKDIIRNENTKNKNTISQKTQNKEVTNSKNIGEINVSTHFHLDRKSINTQNNNKENENDKIVYNENNNSFKFIKLKKDSKNAKGKESRNKHELSKNVGKSRVENLNILDLTHYKNNSDLDEGIVVKKDPKNGKFNESRKKQESSKNVEKSHVENVNLLESEKGKNGKQDRKTNVSGGEIEKETKKIDEQTGKGKNAVPNFELRNTVGKNGKEINEKQKIKSGKIENKINSDQNHLMSAKKLVVRLEMISPEKINEIINQKNINEIKRLNKTNSFENIKQSDDGENPRNINTAENCDKENLVEIDSNEIEIVNTAKVKIKGPKRTQCENDVIEKKLVEVKESVAKVNENEEVDSGEKQTEKEMIEKKETVNMKNTTEINCDNLRRSKRINTMLQKNQKQNQHTESTRQSNQKKSKSKRLVRKSKTRGKSKLETITDKNEEDINENDRSNHNEYVREALAKIYNDNRIDKNKSIIEKSTENIYLVEEDLNTFPDKAANTSISKKKRVFTMINKIYPQGQERKRPASDSFVNDILFVGPSNSRRKTVIPKKSSNINTLIHSSSDTNTFVRPSSSDFSKDGNDDKQKKDYLRNNILRNSVKQFTSTPVKASIADPNKVLKRKRKQNKDLFEVDISKVNPPTEETSNVLKKRKMFSMENYVNSNDFLKTVTLKEKR